MSMSQILHGIYLYLKKNHLLFTISNVTGYSVFSFYLLNLAALLRGKSSLCKSLSARVLCPMPYSLPVKSPERFVLDRVSTKTDPAGTEVLFVGFGSD